jgi:hypothetical protein
LLLLQAGTATCKRLLVEAGAALLAVLRQEVGVMEAFTSVLLQDTAFTGAHPSALYGALPLYARRHPQDSSPVLRTPATCSQGWRLLGLFNPAQCTGLLVSLASPCLMRLYHIGRCCRQRKTSRRRRSTGTACSCCATASRCTRRRRCNPSPSSCWAAAASRHAL